VNRKYNFINLNKNLAIYNMESEFTPEFFDDASKEWMKNKRKTSSGFYIYTCDYRFKHGKRCGRDCYKDNDLCRQHYFNKDNPKQAHFMYNIYQ
jgi:hypothetical protein